jgi:hypothetical protein
MENEWVILHVRNPIGNDGPAFVFRRSILAWYPAGSGSYLVLLYGAGLTVIESPQQVYELLMVVA